MMRKLPFLPILLLVCVCACAFGAQKGRSVERRRAEAIAAGNPEFDIYTSVKSGDWNSDIWCLQRAYYDDPFTETPQRGKRPDKDGTTHIKFARVELTSPAEVLSVYISRPKSELVISRGGVLKVNTRYEGAGGANGTGTVSLEKGGKLLVDTRFILAGKLATENVTGVFNHNGGDATLTTPLHLTGHLTLTSSRTSVGIYNLNGGALNIVQKTPDKIYGGIDNGLGTGRFNFNGGMLNADTIGIDLENTKRGNLSPGGDGEVGETRFFHAVPEQEKTSAVYTQGGGGRLTIDLAGRAKHDKLIWKTKSRGGKVVLRDGAVIGVQYAKGFRPSAGATFDIIEADHIDLQGAPKIIAPAGSNFSCEVVRDKKTGGDILRLKCGV